MTTVEVVLDAGPSWVQYGTVFATPLAALIAGGIAAWSIRVRRRADIRSEWWKRVQYAIEQCFSHEQRRRDVGLEMLTVLGTGHPKGSRFEKPRHKFTRRVLPPKGKSSWVVDADDKEFLRGMIDGIVRGVVDMPEDVTSTEPRKKWIQWRPKRGEP